MAETDLEGGVRRRNDVDPLGGEVFGAEHEDVPLSRDVRDGEPALGVGRDFERVHVERHDQSPRDRPAAEVEHVPGHFDARVEHDLAEVDERTVPNVKLPANPCVVRRHEQQLVVPVVEERDLGHAVDTRGTPPARTVLDAARTC